MISWKNYNKAAVIENLRVCNWEMDKCLDINEKIIKLRKNIEVSAMKLTEKLKLNGKIKRKKWFDENIKEMRKEKIELYMKFNGGL